MKKTIAEDAKLIADYATNNLNLLGAKLGDEYRYRSLSFCIIDAVFSIGVHYSSVQNTVQNYCDFSKQLKFRDADTFLTIDKQESLSSFISSLELIHLNS